MLSNIVFSVVLFGCALGSNNFADPSCDHREPVKCTQPALQYFLQRYVERKTEIVTDKQWTTDMLTQCRLDETGSGCLKEFARRCLPQGKEPTDRDFEKEKTASNCQAKVDRVVIGCPANSSFWHRTCEDPLVEQLYSYLTVNQSSVPSPAEIVRVHTKICCAIDHYTGCVGEQSNVKCNGVAKTTFQDMFRELRKAYQCHPSVSFKDLTC